MGGELFDGTYFFSTGSNDSSNLDKPADGLTWSLLKKSKIIDVNDQLNFKVLAFYIVVVGLVIIVCSTGGDFDAARPSRTFSEFQSSLGRIQEKLDLAQEEVHLAEEKLRQAQEAKLAKKMDRPLAKVVRDVHEVAVARELAESQLYDEDEE